MKIIVLKFLKFILKLPAEQQIWISASKQTHLVYMCMRCAHLCMSAHMGTPRCACAFMCGVSWHGCDGCSEKVKGNGRKWISGGLFPVGRTNFVRIVNFWIKLRASEQQINFLSTLKIWFGRESLWPFCYWTGSNKVNFSMRKLSNVGCAGCTCVAQLLTAYYNRLDGSMLLPSIER
jgi:hypothetical protein